MKHLLKAILILTALTAAQANAAALEAFDSSFAVA
jgi:hypothetical protein